MGGKIEKLFHLSDLRLLLKEKTYSETVTIMSQNWKTGRDTERRKEKREKIEWNKFLDSDPAPRMLSSCRQSFSKGYRKAGKRKFCKPEVFREIIMGQTQIIYPERARTPRRTTVQALSSLYDYFRPNSFMSISG